MLNEITSIKNKRLSIGFLIQFSTGFGGFQDLVWQSMVNAAKEHDVNAYIFAGGSIDTAPYNPYEKNLNLVYDLISQEYLDGLIINYTLGNYISSEQFQDFCQKFSIPIVSIIGAIKGYPSVRVDNKNGMRSAVLHLIEEHNLKKIAFIKGTEGNIDAEERYQIYKETLNECGISFDPDLVYNGAFEEGSGIKAVEYFINEKKKNFQAIVASNDAMAFGAIKGLRKFGKQVPVDIAVIGFDDTDEAKAFTPSLTTVEQPFNEICGKALKVLCDKIAGKSVVESIIVPAKLVIHQSCGCSSVFVTQAKIDEKVLNFKRFDHKTDESRDKIIDKILQELLSVASKNIPEEILVDLINSFIADTENDQSETFLLKLNDIINNKIIKGLDIFVCQGAVFVLRKWIYSLWVDEKKLLKAGNIIFQASIMIGESSKRAMAFQKIIIEKQSKELREAGQELITTFDIDKLKEEIKTQLSRLGISSCFISLFHNMEDENNDSEVFLLFKDDNKGLSDISINYLKHSLPDKMFFPQNRRFTFAIHPLYFRKYKLGYVMFEVGPEDGIVYDALQVQISSSYMGAKLLLEREKTEFTLKQQSNSIQELVRPMLDSINRVTNIAREKISTITRLVELTKENSEKLNSTNNSIKFMSEKIIKMTGVIKIINEISAVVNMLSINTAIESAHAGQYGRGFSVIAEEIQKLADSIKINIQEISNNLKDIRPNIEISQKAGNESQEAFMRLEKDVFEVSKTLQVIMDSMEELSSNSSQILSVMDIS